jgi:hypothetical protein
MAYNQVGESTVPKLPKPKPNPLDEILDECFTMGQISKQFLDDEDSESRKAMFYRGQLDAISRMYAVIEQKMTGVKWDKQH